MNRENIKKVRDHIAARDDERFAMQAYFGIRGDDGVEDNDRASCGATTNARAVEGSCNTCACIAGHAMAALRPDKKTPEHVMRTAGNLLGLTEAQRGRLFEPNNNDIWFRQSGQRLHDISKAQAVLVLDYLLKTGKIDWSAAIGEGLLSSVTAYSHSTEQ